MLQKISNWAVAGVCIVGLVACATGPKTPGTNGDEHVIKLNRTAQGLQHCDADGQNCEEYPYDGNCDQVVITIDTATGQTCETCVVDGAVIDHGCEDARLRHKYPR